LAAISLLQRENDRKFREAVKRLDCIAQAKQMGHDDEAAQRICDAIAVDSPNVMQVQERTKNLDVNNKMSGGAPSKMIENCVKAKMKADDSLSEGDATDECQQAFEKKSAWLDPNTGMSVRPGDTGDVDQEEDDDSDIQQDYTAGTDLGNEGPNFDPNLEISSLDNNAHIDTHMSDDQKSVGDDLDDLSPGISAVPGMNEDLDTSTNDGGGEDDGSSTSDGDMAEVKKTIEQTGSMSADIDFTELSDEDDQSKKDEDESPEEEAQETPEEEESEDLGEEQGGQTLKYKVVPTGFQGPIVEGGKSVAFEDSYLRQAQVQPFESNGRFFVKAFLLDTSVNANNWGVSPRTLDANMSSYIGKPLVLTENFDHPDSGDPDLNHALLYQELYRIGNIVDVVKSGSRYDAICEVTDPYSIDAWRQGDLPLYVSPQLYKENPSESDSEISSWQGTHLALVTNPAYGVKIATSKGTCSGEPDKCLAYLKKASLIEKHGYGSCGYCNRKLLLSAMAIQHSNSVAVTEPKVNIPPASSKTTSSLTPNSGVTLVNDLEQPSSTTTPPNPAANKQPNELQAARKKIATLEQQLAISIKSGELKGNVNADLAKRIAALEAESRHDKVAAILSAANIPQEYLTDERITSLAKSNLPLAEIQSIYKPYTDVGQGLKGASTTSDTSNTQKVNVKYVEPKVSMRSAASENEAPQTNAKPAWLQTHSYLMKGVT